MYNAYHNVIDNTKLRELDKTTMKYYKTSWILEFALQQILLSLEFLTAYNLEKSKMLYKNLYYY